MITFEGESLNLNNGKGKNYLRKMWNLFRNPGHEREPNPYDQPPATSTRRNIVSGKTKAKKRHLPFVVDRIHLLTGFSQNVYNLR